MSWAIKHKGMIYSIAHMVHRRATAAGAAMELDDLVQEGFEIAIQAEQRYDPARGVKESTYLHRALLRGANATVDYGIYQSHHELGDIEAPELGDGFSDDLKLWDFLKTLSLPAQTILLSWLMPSPALQAEIKSRTVGRRCSLKALFHYLREQGCSGDRLDALQNEIFQQVRLYES